MTAIWIALILAYVAIAALVVLALITRRTTRLLTEIAAIHERSLEKHASYIPMLNAPDRIREIFDQDYALRLLHWARCVSCGKAAHPGEFCK